MDILNDKDQVKDLSNNIGLLLSRLIDDNLLICKFPEHEQRHLIMCVISSVVDIFLQKAQNYLPLEYSTENWRGLRLIREILELSIESTVIDIEDLIQCYKNSDAQYMSI